MTSVESNQNSLNRFNLHLGSPESIQIWYDVYQSS